MKTLFFLPKPRYLLSLASLFHTFPNPNPNFQRPPSHKLVKRPPPYRHWDLPIPTPRQTLNPNPNPDPNFSQADFSSICALLTDPALSSGASLEDALSRTGIKPCSGLLQAIFGHFDSSPKPLFTLFCWAVKQPGFESSETLFNFMVDVLAKSRAFDSAWLLLLDRAEAGEQPDLVSSNTFSILIRRYARAGMTFSAIRTFEFACSLDSIRDQDSEWSLLEILLDSLCKEGHVRVASEYFDQQKGLNRWVPSIRVYNILLNGWFRSRKLKHAERLWRTMKKENVIPTVVTYGTLVEGYCRMRRSERAIELVDEMRGEGIEPNAIVYNPIIDSFSEAGRFKEAMGMMERCLVSETGPTLSTYNSLVKGFCKAGDLVGASKVLKMMISRDVAPTLTTYNYFLRYFSRCGKIEEGMNLYTKMIESGHTPDRLSYHLLIKMMCEEERLGLAMQVRKEMRVRGCDLDLATSTMLIHLLCKMRRLEEAFAEFEDMIRRGIVPQYLTFERMNNALRKQGLTEMARKLCEMMTYVPHSSKLPNTYSGDGDASRERKTSILQRAEAMSDILKTCNDPRELVKLRSSFENSISVANRLIGDIKRRANKT